MRRGARGVRRVAWAVRREGEGGLDEGLGLGLGSGLGLGLGLN